MSGGDSQSPPGRSGNPGLGARGEDTLSVGFGPLVVQLDGLSRQDVEVLRPSYAGFLAPEEVPDLRLEVRQAEARAFLEGSPGEDHRVETAEAGAVLQVWSYRFAADLEPEERCGRVQLCHSGADELRVSVENLFRFSVARLALERGGAVLHAAALAEEGAAHVFLGAEGAGKSTLAESAAGELDVLGDDLVLVLPDDGTYRVWGVPFHGTFVSAKTRGQTGILASLWLLQRGDKAEARNLPAARQRAAVLEAVSFVGGEAGLSRALEMAARLLEAHPVRLLLHAAGIEPWGQTRGVLRL